MTTDLTIAASEPLTLAVGAEALSIELTESLEVDLEIAD